MGELERETVNAGMVADQLTASQPVLVKAAMDHFYAIHPELAEKYGSKGLAASYRDAGYHMQYLIEAVRRQNPNYFAEYIAWVNHMLQRRMPKAAPGHESNPGYLDKVLELFAQQIRKKMGEPIWLYIQPLIDAGINKLALQENPAENYVLPPAEAIKQSYLNAILQGNRLLAQELVMDAFRNGFSVRDVYLNVFQPALYEVGMLWETGQISVAREHLATAITQTILSRIYSETELAPSNGESAVVACLGGNYHEIGARMVADFLQLSGYEAIFLGANTPDDDLLTMVDELKPSIVGLPSTLSWQVNPVQTAIEKIHSDFKTYRPTILVGGMAFNLQDGLWKQVGADLWGKDAGEALDNLQG